jgi:glycosyltransferase involved in cell wall biosynthesis
MNMLRLGIIVADELESHLKIAKNIAKFANAEICKLTCNSDVIVAMDSSLPYLPPLILGKLRGAITAAFIHDVRSISHTHLTAEDAGRRPLEQRLRRMSSLNLVKPLIDIPLSPTHAIASVVREYAKVEPCVVYLGVDHSIYRPLGNPKLRSRERRVILTVATKPHIVKASMAIFRNLPTKAKLLIRGPCIVKAPEVLCVPKLPEPELAKLYSYADVLLYPSLHEGFGLVVLEAMACGTPVIAFEEPAVVEVAGDAAVFVKPTSLKEVAEIVDGVLSDDYLLEELRARALRRAREFSWRRSVEELYACILRKLVR